MSQRTKPAQEIGRLALRREGEMWNAYYALTDTMDGAIPLGGIALRFVASRPERKDAFMALMKAAVADLIEELTGERPTWQEPGRAPETERAGHA